MYISVQSSKIIFEFQRLPAEDKGKTPCRLFNWHPRSYITYLIDNKLLTSPLDPIFGMKGAARTTDES
ncbi:hypothetical protein AYI68_g2325 [Smittium mucronatum]|uniref:Uncharacterized protein n=1 Tax=Smittium mucronatum TaxID=133383 RepID=A0A1R0H338_9FUNG|nr:hypothetical protein AYI68_g2325 [Smittium mucronatum]